LDGVLGLPHSSKSTAAAVTIVTEQTDVHSTWSVSSAYVNEQNSRMLYTSKRCTYMYLL